MTNQDHVSNILDDVLVLLSGQGFPTPERTYKLDGGWGLALSDLRRCFDQYRARIADLEAERDAARAGEARAVEALEAEQRAAHWRNLARITDKHEDALEAGRLSEIAQRLRRLARPAGARGGGAGVEPTGAAWKQQPGIVYGAVERDQAAHRRTYDSTTYRMPPKRSSGKGAFSCVTP